MFVELNIFEVVVRCHILFRILYAVMKERIKLFCVKSYCEMKKKLI